ncbi:MAG: TPR end-of-group domain-containing protein [Planctomyces sp.]
MRKFPALLAICCLLGSSLLARRCALRTPERIHARPAEIFSLPQQQLQLQQLSTALQAAIRTRQFAQALAISSEITQQTPKDTAAWYNHARLLALNEQNTAALSALNIAVQLGFNQPDALLQNPELASLRSLPGFSLLLRQAGQNPAVTRTASETTTSATPALLTEQTAIVSVRNTRWVPADCSLVTEFQAPPTLKHKRSLPQITTASPAAALVNQWIQQGSAAGFHGLLYDNRDRDHSTLQPAEFPGLTFVEYAPEARAANADYGIRPFQRFNLPTLGNASTAYVDPILWRSNPRMLLSSELHAALTAQSWYRNQMYCYPEHRDYDPDHGDMFPVNTPFWIISQGSSGSDQPFMKAILLTIAALHPDVRNELEHSGRLMEIAQWIMRRSLKFVDPAGMQYLSGRAHPVVFQEHDLDTERMVQLAHSLQPSQLPAIAKLSVISEDSATPDTDYFSGQLTEVILNTPIAVGRVYRTLKRSRSMVVDVAAEQLQIGRSPRCHWVVLQSGPDQVHIKPLNTERSRVEITVKWGPAFQVPWQPEMHSQRVDVGVFIDDGVSVSLPAIVSTLLPPCESRTYAGTRLIAVDYNSPQNSPPATDPLLFPTRRWRDEYQYTDQQLTGWIRHSPGQPPAEFNHLGQLKNTTPDGQKLLLPVEYPLSSAPGQPPELLWKPRNSQP